MLALVQRVSTASVVVEQREVGRIGAGMLVFLGVEKGDEENQADQMSQRLLAYRMFSDESGRMNLDLRQSGGGLLLISQFTLAADTRRGLRPSFTGAADPELAENLYRRCLFNFEKAHEPVASGVFGAHMDVSLINDGPVTFMLKV